MRPKLVLNGEERKKRFTKNFIEKEQVNSNNASNGHVESRTDTYTPYLSQKSKSTATTPEYSEKNLEKDGKFGKVVEEDEVGYFSQCQVKKQKNKSYEKIRIPQTYKHKKFRTVETMKYL